MSGLLNEFRKIECEAVGHVSYVPEKAAARWKRAPQDGARQLSSEPEN